MIKTIKELPLGSRVKHEGMTYKGKTLEWIKVTNDGHYDKGQTIFIMADPTDAVVFDENEPKHPDSDMHDGNPNYEVSNIDLWLNSRRQNWYTPQHKYDEEPRYSTKEGFMYSFTLEAFNKIKSTTIDISKVQNRRWETESIGRKMFLLSIVEAGWGKDNKGDYDGWRGEGKLFPYFQDTKNHRVDSKLHSYWTRTSTWIHNEYEMHGITSEYGSRTIARPHEGGRGARPAMSLDSSELVKQGEDGVYELSYNTPPTISGKDEDLGNISDEISKTYTVFDEDDDKLSIIERLNNTVIGVHNDVKSGTSKTLTIPKEDIYKLDIGKRNTISIEASDGQEKTYRNWKFTRTNTAPIIQVLTDTELGNIIKPFETRIKVSDPEHDKVNVIYTVNRIVLDENESYTRIPVDSITKEDIKLDSELKYTIDKEAWDKLLIGDYELEIKAIDDQSGENKEIIKFSRTEDQIDFITSAIVKEVQPKQFISLWLINGSPKNIKIEACNNGLDDKPTWEDVTTEAMEAVPYNFKNNTKTADKWAVIAKVYLDGKEGTK